MVLQCVYVVLYCEVYLYDQLVDVRLPDPRVNACVSFAEYCQIPSLGLNHFTLPLACMQTPVSAQLCLQGEDKYFSVVLICIYIIYEWSWIFFHIFNGYFYMSVYRASAHVFCPFFYGTFGLFSSFFNFWRSLLYKTIRLLSVIQFIDIFPEFVTCPLGLLMIVFAMESFNFFFSQN